MEIQVIGTTTTFRLDQSAHRVLVQYSDRLDDLDAEMSYVYNGSSLLEYPK